MQICPKLSELFFFISQIWKSQTWIFFPLFHNEKIQQGPFECFLTPCVFLHPCINWIRHWKLLSNEKIKASRREALPKLAVFWHSPRAFMLWKQALDKLRHVLFSPEMSKSSQPLSASMDITPCCCFRRAIPQ